MKLIGAGFGRTGTMSLKAALEQVGYGPCFHMIDLIKGEMPLPDWDAASRGEEVDYVRALQGWESTIDWPACTYWERLVEIWPDAKVLLSVRDPDKWYESCLNSIHEAAEMGTRGELGGGPVPPPSTEVMEVINRIVWEGTFENRFEEDRQFAIDTFNSHNEAVRAKVPADRLLVYEVKEGWGTLCEFLEVDEPDAPFPHLNDTASFRGMFGMPALSS
jgi:sulfotransferase family protein